MWSVGSPFHAQPESGLSCVPAGVEGLLVCAAWRGTLPPLAVTLRSTLRIQWGWDHTRWSGRSHRRVDELPGIECGEKGSVLPGSLLTGDSLLL